MLLFVAGAAMVVLAITVEDRDVVAGALVGFGAALMPLAVLLPRLVGRLRLSAQGFEAEVTAVVKAEAEAKGLSADATRQALVIARSDSQAALREFVDDLLREAERQAEAGEAIQIDIDRFREAFEDPRVQRFLREAEAYWQLPEPPRGSE